MELSGVEVFLLCVASVILTVGILIEGFRRPMKRLKKSNEELMTEHTNLIMRSVAAEQELKHQVRLVNEYSEAAFNIAIENKELKEDISNMTKQISDMEFSNRNGHATIHQLKELNKLIQIDLNYSESVLGLYIERDFETIKKKNK